ncbi:hypothetical protein Asera_01110 [Actinocatenispora sera]|uniref:Uncharacterized protein n=1 Tax=Actinocatenispora sera TaxID=390989 RepID=A0A810KS23_9ACTN|nr:hypothetical protein Asera_01110 [Actinocatenispora sera]
MLIQIVVHDPVQRPQVRRQSQPHRRLGRGELLLRVPDAERRRVPRAPLVRRGEPVHQLAHGGHCLRVGRSRFGRRARPDDRRGMPRIPVLGVEDHTGDRPGRTVGSCQVVPERVPTGADVQLHLDVGVVGCSQLGADRARHLVEQLPARSPPAGPAALFEADPHRRWRRPVG